MYLKFGHSFTLSDTLYVYVQTSYVGRTKEFYIYSYPTVHCPEILIDQHNYLLPTQAPSILHKYPQHTGFL